MKENETCPTMKKYKYANSSQLKEKAGVFYCSFWSVSVTDCKPTPALLAFLKILFTVQNPD